MKKQFIAPKLEAKPMQPEQLLAGSEEDVSVHQGVPGSSGGSRPGSADSKMNGQLDWFDGGLPS